MNMELVPSDSISDSIHLKLFYSQVHNFSLETISQGLFISWRRTKFVL